MVLGLAAALLAALPAPASASAPSPSYAETHVRAFDLQIPAGVGGERALSETATECYGPWFDELPVGYPRVTRGITRFIARESGEILDTTRIVVPGPRNSPFGKPDFLLGRVPGSAKSAGRGKTFAHTPGFTDSGLETSLRGHVVDNSGSCSHPGQLHYGHGASDRPKWGHARCALRMAGS